MECVVVCAAGAGALDGVFAVAAALFAFAVAAAVVVAVVSALAGYAWALAVTVGVANVAMGWLLVRVYRYGPTLEVFRRHRRARAWPVRRAAITVGQAAIEGKIVNMATEHQWAPYTGILAKEPALSIVHEAGLGPHERTCVICSVISSDDDDCDDLDCAPGLHR